MRADRGRTFGLLLITYLALTEALHVLWTGRFALGPEMIVKALIVPALQTALLEGVRALVRRAPGALATDSLARFVGRWALLAVTIAATTPAIDFLMVRRLDLTAGMFLALLVTPAIQAGVVGDARRGPCEPVWPIVARHPLLLIVLAIDGVMLAAGWTLASDQLVGMSEAAVLQRRWMGSKLLAAALVFSVWPVRGDHAIDSRRAALGLTLILAAIALSLFAPALLAVAVQVLSVAIALPLAILLLGIYAGAFLLVVGAAVALRHAIADRRPVAHRLIAWATLTLFAATLALLMNGFSSMRAVPPWAGLAVTGGSLAATCFLAAALVLGTRPGRMP